GRIDSTVTATLQVRKLWFFERLRDLRTTVPKRTSAAKPASILSLNEKDGHKGLEFAEEALIR
ncbi:hypothetical protein ABTM70_20210, partial [Acinetobacter baumannii]